MNPAPWDWDFLIHRHLSGGLTEEQRAALNGQLRTDPRLRRRLAELAFEQAQYKDLLADARPEPVLIIPDDAHEPVEEPAAAPLLKPVAPPIPTLSRFRSRKARLGLAAAALLVLAAGAVFWGTRGGASPYEIVSGDVKAEGGRVEVSGTATALFRLKDGSQAELAPSSIAVFHGRVGDARQVVELSQGTGTFKVAKAPDSFRVDTPAGRVAVLGTEFTVELRKAKKRAPLLAVSVVSGRVRVESGGQLRELGSGESQVFGADPEERKEPRAVFSGVVHGKVAFRGDAHIVLSVDRVVRAHPEVSPAAAASMVGRSIRINAPAARKKEGEPEPLALQYLRKLQPGQEIALDIRALKTEEFAVGTLDPEQAEWAQRREATDKKKTREPGKSPDREDDKDK